MTRYVQAHKDAYGVEPICQVLEIAPSTYYAAVSRTPSRRRLRDAQLKLEIERVHADNFGVYGIEKVWRQLNREGVVVGRERVARLMRELGLEGAVRGKMGLGPQCPTSSPRGRPIWSTASSRRWHRTGSGSPT